MKIPISSERISRVSDAARKASGSASPETAGWIVMAELPRSSRHPAEWPARKSFTRNNARARPKFRSAKSGRDACRGLGGDGFLAYDRRDFRAVQFDRLHQLGVRHRSDRHLQQEAIVPEDAMVGDDLFGDFF